MWLKCVQAPDKSGSKCGERYYDGTCHRGVTKWRGLPDADGQASNKFTASKRSEVMEEPCWLVAKIMVAGEGEDSSEATSMRA